MQAVFSRLFADLASGVVRLTPVAEVAYFAARLTFVCGCSSIKVVLYLVLLVRS